jgi:hypothetical protein
VSASLVEQAGQLKIKIGTEPVMVLRAVGRAAYPGTACARVGVDDTRIGAQWNVLAKATAMTATPPTRVGGGAECSRSCRDPRRLPTSRKSQVGPKPRRCVQLVLHQLGDRLREYSRMFLTPCCHGYLSFPDWDPIGSQSGKADTPVREGTDPGGKSAQAPASEARLEEPSQ